VAPRTNPRPSERGRSRDAGPAATLGELHRQLTLDLAGVAEAPDAEARFLLCGLLDLAPLELTLRRGEPVAPADAARARDGLARRLRGDPPQRIVGWTDFRGLRIAVDEHVLIPRPETEELVERALASRAGSPGTGVAADVGTGCGAIALALKAERPRWRILASEISPAAAATARRNAAALDLSIELIETSLLEALPGGLDLVVSNPPYLPDAWCDGVPDVVLREPPLALWGGPDGLALARPLALQAAKRLRSGGELHLELDPVNVRVLAAELESAGWRDVEVATDLAGRDRFLSAVRT
jgi:release factor glutamine methyltransferase